MNKILFLFSLVLFSSVSIAQSKEQKNIKKVVEKVMELNEAGKYKQALDFTYPQLFELVPRELMEEQIDKLFGDNGEMSINMENFEMSEVGEIVNAKTADYAFVPYSFLMTMTYNEGEFTEEGFGFIKSALQGKFGEENVTMDYEKRSFFIQSNSRMIAIKDHDTKDWKLLQLDESQIEMFKMILPEDIAEAI